MNIIMAVAQTDKDQVLMFPVITKHDSIEEAKKHFFKEHAAPEADCSIEVKTNGTIQITYDQLEQTLATIKVVM